MEIAPEGRCSFCGKRQDQVAKLIAGQKIADQTVFICNECARLCRDIVDEELGQKPPEEPKSGGWMERLRRVALTFPR